jgi:hypothetical protein
VDQGRRVAGYPGRTQRRADRVCGDPDGATDGLERSACLVAPDEFIDVGGTARASEVPLTPGRRANFGDPDPVAGGEFVETVASGKRIRRLNDAKRWKKRAKAAPSQLSSTRLASSGCNTTSTGPSP